jgi:hypothetical protein
VSIEKIAKTVVLLNKELGKLSVTLNQGKRGFHVGWGYRAANPDGTLIDQTVRGGAETFATFAEGEKAHAKKIADAIAAGWKIREGGPGGGKLTSIPGAGPVAETPAPAPPALVKKSAAKV